VTTNGIHDLSQDSSSQSSFSQHSGSQQATDPLNRNTSHSPSELTARKTLLSNIVWNLAGKFAPFILGVFTVPVILKGIGNERYGILTFIWMIIGYANLFDFGLGKALTHLVAEKLANRQDSEIPRLIWTAVFTILPFSLSGVLLLVLGANWIVLTVFRVSAVHYPETVSAFTLFACCLPVFIITAMLGGVLAAYQKFLATTLITMPLAFFNFVAPVIVLLWSDSLTTIVAALVLGRFITFIAHVWVCYQTVPHLSRSIGFGKQYLRPLFSFGGWLTLSNLVNPFLVSLDRLIISTLGGVMQVPYYTIPYDALSKVLIVPAAINSVLFPALSMECVHNPGRARRLFVKSSLTTAGLLVLPMLLLSGLMPWVLRFWISAEFSRQATPVAQILTAAFFINALASFPFTFIQARGNPRITSLNHLCQLPITLVLTGLLVHHMGLPGAAWAWLVRVILDCVFLYAYALHCLRKEDSANV
jgi:O-antigen/teichoic acid export membrane protein